MNLIQIKDDISNGKNLIFYNKDVYNCYKQLKNDFYVYTLLNLYQLR